MPFVKLFECYECEMCQKKAHTKLNHFQHRSADADADDGDDGDKTTTESVAASNSTNVRNFSSSFIIYGAALATAMTLKINCHKIRNFGCQSSIYELCRIDRILNH